MSDDHDDRPDDRDPRTASGGGADAAGSGAGAGAGEGVAAAPEEGTREATGARPDDDVPHGRSPEWGRRELFKAMASVPVLGTLAYGVYRKSSTASEKRRKIFEELGVTGDAPAVIPNAVSSPPGERLRLGVIGYGGRGQADIRGAGFAPTEWTDSQARAAARNPRNQNLATFLDQHDLNLDLTAVCDLFDVYAVRGIDASANPVRPGGREQKPARRYRTYEELLESGTVDLILCATPDHWHSRITIAAAERGVHVYCEKAMTRTEEEAREVAAAVRASGIQFQLGHQNRQSEAHVKAREICAKNILGPITLVETTTNRNDPIGAWVYRVHDDANPETIDWAQFEAASPHPTGFSAERFFRWRCWFDYGTGLAGDLLSHEYDAINQILDLGIPASASASGGVYFYKDGRDVPDTFQVAYEYPERDLTLLYSATLANGRGRGKVMMGHDATMEVGSGVTVIAEGQSTRYGHLIDEEVVDPSKPLLTYRPGFRGIDAVTTATEQYFASRGLLFTYRGDRRFDPTHLHVKEWVDAIRNGGTTSCNIERGFEEAITCHMATESYLRGTKVHWDPVQERIV